VNLTNNPADDMRSIMAYKEGLAERGN
jgi:hypothetical protein